MHLYSQALNLGRLCVTGSDGACTAGCHNTDCLCCQCCSIHSAQRGHGLQYQGMSRSLQSRYVILLLHLASEHEDIQKASTGQSLLDAQVWIANKFSVHYHPQ